MRLGVVVMCVIGCRFGFDAGVPDGDATDGPNDAPTDAPVGRVANGLVALYSFDEGTGAIARDQSGVAPALDLAIGSDATWVVGGLEFGASATGARSAAAEKITTACMASGEVTVEAWVRSTSLASAGAERIIGVAGNNNVSVVSLGQEGTGYYGQVRSTAGSTKLASDNATTTMTAIHLAHTRTQSGVRTTYLDATIANTTAVGGDLSNWDPLLPVTAGNSPDGGVRWPGQLLLAAFYCRALSEPEVAQNFMAGP